MSDSNSNINTSNTNYKNIWDYFKKEYVYIYPATILISVIVLSIFKLIYNNWTNSINPISPSLFAFSLTILITLGFGFFIILEAKSVLEEQAEVESEAEEEALLKENDICKLNPDICMHGGKCQSIPPDYQNYTCNCTAGWEGKNCNIPDGGLIKESDIDPRCTNPETGEKHAD